LDFIPSRPLTVGVELELQLLDPDSLDLIDGIQPLTERYPDSPYIKPEFIQNTVEVTSRIGDNVADVHAHLVDITRELKHACAELNMATCAAGTHPFGRELATITPSPRYQQMEKVSGIMGHTQITYATHVHIGVETAGEAIHLMRVFKAYLPLLIALSASSPFWRGYDTGYVSYRHCILAASRSYGIPPTFESWEQFTDFFHAMQRAGLFKHFNDIHWDIRLRPHLGTVELRVMDAQPTISEAMQLAALVRVLAHYHLQHRDNVPGYLPHALHWWSEKDNCFTASRLGLQANTIVDNDGSFRELQAIWKDVYAAIKSHAVGLGEAGYLEKLKARIEQGDISYKRQHRIYETTGSCKRVVSSLIRELEDDLGWP
jgi:carboxylate-amine ligase